MSDPILREVDEEVRRERLKKLWERYGGIVIAVAVLIVVGVGGWRTWEWYEQRQAAQAGAAFETAVQLAEEGKSAEAIAAFEKLVTEGTSGYRLLARFREAAELADKDRAAAVKIYDAIAADTGQSPAVRDLAAIRAALLLVDTASIDEMQKRLETLTAGGRPFRHTARELMALSAWRAGDAAATRKWVDLIVTDPETPPNTRARVEVLAPAAPAVGKG